MLSILAIFPLPGLILFPGTYLPLHIFEPRYRLMLDYCTESDYEIGITALHPGGDIETIFGWGKIIDIETLPDGRSNILVEGLGIANIENYDSKDPFIIANVKKQENELSHLNSEDFQILLNKLINQCRQYLHKVGIETIFIDELLKLKLHSFPIEFMTSILNINFDVKNDIFLTKDGMEKAYKLEKVIETLLK
ncbi:MAG: LON peptidase substrate-binding domain-containing protein [Leptospiraceae bacterium]|nr:LON peptidase substrate-binding domain-containing protein [Leptospiraceae bacterium]MCP5500542.1 LON peptidase substrate-binding domain-containing protein [Leptospiraceae bacterium]